MPNRLIHQTSPYLLQHAHNPVDWYPWGPEALAAAQAQNKLLLVSIGYAACHWCHVMERECFEDPEVARIMNASFICIKIDREERPDIDKIYMDAVMLMTGRGGWPLNAIALPDGRPVYGGTYFPRQTWVQVLRQLADLYAREPERAFAYAEELAGAIIGMDQPTGGGRTFSPEDFDTIRQHWLSHLDPEWGGRQVNANKFPLPANNLFLLRAGWLARDEEMLAAAHLALEKMALGGIFDQLGGGFARYSVDPVWKVPHFEKMLYDNGQLISLYAEAWLQSPHPLYAQVIRQTLDWVAREMTAPEGAIYAALDADSEGVEGKFYTWTYDEVAAVLGEDTRLFADYYNVSAAGNWEHTNVLFALEPEGEYAMRWGLDSSAVQNTLAACRERLLAARGQRIRPGLDDKILTSWNALMLKGYVDAYRALGSPAYLAAALRIATFVREHMTDGGRLWRTWKAGKPAINAFLDDYAALTEALLALYQVTFDVQWLQQAETHVAYVMAHFSNPGNGLFFYTSDEDPVLIRRKTEVQDDVIPSSNALLAHSLFTLGLLLDRAEYQTRAQQMIAAVQGDLLANPDWHACWALLMLRYYFPHYEVVIGGPEAVAQRPDWEAFYYPNRIFAGATQPGDLPLLQGRVTAETLHYVCEGQTCQLPATTAATAAGYMLT
ncbi:MAG: thioredoxin domain-containing protein [Bacteroidia bacterium]|nr:thioredoxin domain-containing protein [Bacteroidia bacterium]